MKTKYKKKIFFAPQYDAGAIQQFLEDMAARGYMYVKCQGLFFCFEECEPRKIKFQVDYFDKASIMDTNPEEATLEYMEYCQACGWKHLYSNGKMQVFYSEEDAPPLHTDEEIKFKYLVKNALLLYGIQWFIVPLIYLFSCVFPYVSKIFGSGEHSAFQYAMTAANCATFFMPLAGILFILYNIASLIRFLIFYIKNRKWVKTGKPIEFYSYRNAKRFGIFSVNCLLVIMLIVILGFSNQWQLTVIMALGIAVILGVVLAAVKFLQSQYANRALNIIISIAAGVIGSGAMIVIIIFGVLIMTWGESETVEVNGVLYSYSSDDIPVTLEELGIDSSEYNFLYEEKYKDDYQSPWAKYISYWNAYVAMDEEEDSEMPYFKVDIFESHVSKLTEGYREKWLQNTKYDIEFLSQETANDWGVEKAYSIKVKNLAESEARLFLIKGKKTIVIAGKFEASEEAREALKTLY